MEAISVETEKLTAKFWERSPAANLACTSAMSLPVTLPYPMIKTPDGQLPASSTCSPLPGFSSFLTCCRPPRNMTMHLSTKTVEGLQSGVQQSRSVAIPPNSSVHGNRASVHSSGVPFYMPNMNPVAVPSTFPMIAQKDSAAGHSKAALAGPRHPLTTQIVTNNSLQPTANISQQTSPSFFRPVGVLLKKNKPVAGNTTFLSQSTSAFYQRPMHGSAYLYCCTASATRPRWTNTDVHTNLSSNQQGQYNQGYGHGYMTHTSQIHPFNHTYPCQPHHSNSEMQLAQARSTPGGMKQCDTNMSSSLHRPTDVPQPAALPPPQYDAKSDVKVVPYLHAAGECVDNNVSVVTLRAHDMTLFVTNHTGTTSQTESEYSLHDAKMQLTKSREMPMTSNFQSLSPSFNSPPAQPVPRDAITNSNPQPSPNSKLKLHPGLDMLSDVSLLVESLTSPVVTEKCSGIGNMANNMNATSPQIDNVETGLCPPHATYVGTIQFDPYSAVEHGYPDQLDGSILLNTEANYTQMDPPPLQDVSCAEDHQTCGPHREDYTLMLPPKKSTKFTRDVARDSVSGRSKNCQKNCDVDDLKLSAYITENRKDKVSKRGRPRKKVDQPNVMKAVPHDSRRAQRGRPRKRKDPDENTQLTSKQGHQPEVTCQKENHQSKENGCQTDYTSKSSKQSLKKREDVCQFKPELQVAKSSSKVTDSADDFHVSVRSQVCHKGNGACDNGGSNSSVSQDFIPNGESIPLCQGNTLDKVCVSPAGDKVVLNAPSEAAAVSSEANGCDATAPCCAKPELDYEIINTKDDFDALIIAEEEVTSTQMQDNVTQSDADPDVKPAVDNKTQEISLRQRSHMCVSCFTFPSSSDDSSIPSPGLASCSSSKPCGIKKLKRRTKNSIKREPSQKIQTLVCEVCGRNFATKSNLSRHRRYFHPSLLFDTGIVELPLVPAVPPMLPLSPSSIPSVKSPSSIKNLNIEMDGRDRCRDRIQDRLRSETKRRKRRVKSVDEVWEPKPLKKKKKERAASCQMNSLRSDMIKTEQQQTTLSGKEGGKTKRKREKVSRRGRAACSDHWIRVALNFRTKKRTRVNSTIPCPYCDRLFSVMSNLKRHTKQQHQDVYVFVCNVCQNKFNMRRTLKKHTKEKHAKDFPFSCPECLTSFRLKSEMNTHRQVHEIARYPCEDCNLVYYTEEHLSDHVAQYHITE